MYNIIKQTHENYGCIIVIEHTADGKALTPFQAVRSAIKDQEIWIKEISKKVRLLIDDQIMSPQQAECWAKEEYKNLPKCKLCAKVLNEDVITNQFSNSFFCSEDCADKDYNERIEQSKYEEEIEL